jgi:hypothetical protein
VSARIHPDRFRLREIDHDEEIDVKRRANPDEQIQAIDLALRHIRPARDKIAFEMLGDVGFVLG